MKSVDTRDLKSLAFRSVPVQVWPRAPFKISMKSSRLTRLFLYLKFPVFLNLSPSRYLIAVIFFINILYTSQMVTNRAACSCFKCSLSLIYAFHPYLVYLTHAKRRHFSSTLAITNRACFSLSAFILLHLYHINNPYTSLFL